MPKPTNPARNAELAAIHIAKAEAGMADDSYRDMLWTICRVRSAADLDYAGRRRVLDHLRKLAGDEWDFAKTMPEEKQKMLWKIRRLCMELKIRRGNQIGVLRDPTETVAAMKVGGYYVVYEDGYKSFSPAEAFESGYKRV